MKKISTVKAFAVLAVVLSALLPLKAEGAEQEEVPPAWKTRVELSYVNTSGNSEASTLAGKLEVKKEGPVNRYFLNGSLLRAQSDGDETSDKLSLSVRWERALTRRNFALLTVGYLRDRFSGYEFRAFAGAGLGRDFVKTSGHRFQGVATLLYYHDEFSSGPVSVEDYPAGKLTAKYEYTPRENLKFGETLEFFASLEETERYFVDSTTSVEIKVNSAVSVGLNYIVNYQNKVPSPEILHTDTTFLTTLIIDF